MTKTADCAYWHTAYWHTADLKDLLFWLRHVHDRKKSAVFRASIFMKFRKTEKQYGLVSYTTLNKNLEMNVESADRNVCMSFVKRDLQAVDFRENYPLNFCVHLYRILCQTGRKV